jgi:hypothetical protein
MDTSGDIWDVWGGGLISHSKVSSDRCVLAVLFL